MNQAFLPVAFVLTTILIASPLAQTGQPAERPGRYLLTEQLTITESKAPSYPAVVARIRDAADRTKVDTWRWVAAANMTGDLRRVTNLTFYESFGAFERDVPAIRNIIAAAIERDPWFTAGSGEQALARRSSLAVLREDLSFQPNKVPPSAARYWAVTTIFLKAGRMSDFAERTTMEIDLLKRGGLDHHFLVYQVLHGVPSSGSVFYVITPMKTLAEMDADDSEKAAALFTADVRRRFETINREMIGGVESDLLMVRPDLSRPPAAYALANPSFWAAGPAR